MSRSTSSVKKDNRISSDLWDSLAPECEKAAAFSQNSIEAWARCAHLAVEDAAQRADWRGRLADMRERCIQARYECPYTVTYLVQLAETYKVVKYDFAKGVPASVLIEGRNLPDLLDVVEQNPGMTVGRMKAHVFKHSHDDPRSVEEIEVEQSRHRRDDRERKTREDHASKLRGAYNAENADDLLRTIEAETQAYRSAIVAVVAEGGNFSPIHVAQAQDAISGLLTKVEEQRIQLAKAA